MKKLILLFTKLLLYPVLISTITGLLSFKNNAKFNAFSDKSPLASSYTSQVLDKWMGMQIKLMSTTIANFNGPFVRIYAYSGLAAFESIFPGIEKNSSHQFSSTALNNIPVMPGIEQGKKYHWPSSINAALA